MNERQAMHSPVLQMDEPELRWIWAWCERQCLNRTDPAEMERFERRMLEVQEELERRRVK